jgi:hypothetical protein
MTDSSCEFAFKPESGVEKDGMFFSYCEFPVGCVLPVGLVGAGVAPKLPVEMFVRVWLILMSCCKELTCVN